MSNLYHFFSCNTREELYKKVKDDEESVRSLVDFIEYSKGNLQSLDKPITSPEAFIEAVVDKRMPVKDEILSVFVNTKNIPVHVGRINDSNNMSSRKLVLKEGLKAGGVRLLLLGNVEGNCHSTQEYFKTFGLDVLDVFRYSSHNNSVRSDLENIPRQLDNFVKEEIDKNIATYAPIKNEFSNYEGFEEFSSYYSEEEIKGLNIFEDNIEIQDILKVGYQYDWQESFGVISCNSDGYVTSFSELFKGSPDSTIVDRKVFTKELLSKEDTSFVVVFHNHPSGDITPSQEDKNVTNWLKDVSETLDLKLLDHLIVGKEKVHSFAKESSNAISYNERYAEKIKEQSKHTYRQKTFDFDM